MSRDTNIEWCDSSVNPVMGCKGCELWSPTEGGTCYAARMVDQYAGNKGMPVNFQTPTKFEGRMSEATKWGNLAGKDRSDKPWLNGRARHIFITDMGDMYSASIDYPWIWKEVFQNTMSPSGRQHVWLTLTKRVSRLVAYEQYMRQTQAVQWLPNVMAMASITSTDTLPRLTALWQLPTTVPIGLSIEPLLGPVNLTPLLMECQREQPLDWIIVGAESGDGARPMNLDWVREIRDVALDWNIPFFYKQNATDTGTKIHVPELDGIQWTQMPDAVHAVPLQGELV